jgi:hypothetical protein
VLLAGDAAHIHLPAGGQGLNLGVQDAMNLGWKLAAVAAGQMSEDLLDTYHAERHPVGAQVIENTRAQSVLQEGGVEAAAMRAVFSRMLELPETNAHLAGLISGIGLRYEFDGADHELLGLRLPDLDLPDVTVSELFHNGQGVLLSTAPAYLAEAQPWADRGRGVQVEDLPAEALLVRPDRYICWVAPGQPVTEPLTTWFGA